MVRDYTGMKLGELEEARRLVLERIAAVPAFRRGSLQIGYRKCGNASCGCAQPGARGHGPRALWTRTVTGLSRGQVIPMDRAEQVQGELENYSQFADLVEDFVEINEELCKLRVPPPKRGRPPKTVTASDPASGGEKGGSVARTKMGS